MLPIREMLHTPMQLHIYHANSKFCLTVCSGSRRANRRRVHAVFAARNFQVLLQLIQTPEHAQGICDVHTCMGRGEVTCKRERGARRDRISAGVGP